MNARREYLEDLLEDCLEAARRAGVAPGQEGAVVAALILSDSLNGLRKAVLQMPGPRRAGREDPEGRA